MKEKMKNAVEKSMVTVSKSRVKHGAKNSDTVGCERLVTKNPKIFRIRWFVGN